MIQFLGDAGSPSIVPAPDLHEHLGARNGLCGALGRAVCLFLLFFFNMVSMGSVDLEIFTNISHCRRGNPALAFVFICFVLFGSGEAGDQIRRIRGPLVFASRPAIKRRSEEARDKSEDSNGQFWYLGID